MATEFIDHSNSNEPPEDMPTNQILQWCLKRGWTLRAANRLWAQRVEAELKPEDPRTVKDES